MEFLRHFTERMSATRGSAVGKLLGSAFRRYSRRFLFAGVLMLVGVGLQYVFPYLTVFIIDVVLPSKDFSLLSSVVLISVLLYLVIGISDLVSGLLFYYSREKTLQDLQMNVFEHTEYLYLQDFEERRNENIYSYLIKDVQNLKGLLADTIFFAAKDLLTMMVGLFLLFRLKWFLASLVLMIIAFVLWTSILFGRGVRERIASYHSAAGQFISSLITSLFNLYFVKIYSIEEIVRRKIKLLQDRQFALSYRLETLRHGSGSIVRFLATATPPLILWYAGIEIMGGTFTLGQLVGFNFIVSLVLGACQHLASANLDIESARGSVRRLGSLLELPVENTPAGRRISVQSDEHISVVFEDVSFCYDGRRPALQHITFSVDPGEIVSFVGHNGSGKSTIMKLLLKLYDDYEGAISLNGCDIKYADRFDIRRMIAVVPQDVFIFEGSVKENIVIGSPMASDSEVFQAARNVGIHELIESLPLAYDTPLSSATVPFSGGEKQRLALARALLKGAKVLILDEATSQIDSESDFLIRKTLRDAATKGAAVMIIAHRLSTVAGADKIVVLHEGRIVDMGKHWELYQRCESYRAFSEFQLIKPRLDEITLAP